jgi:3-hydroxyacyl-[acyl-carrier-protein] dehydratase
VLSPEEILERIPQQEPFRFIDAILEVDDDHVVASYRWRPEADFYRGHFPGQPVTPGVLLVESMAQASVVALGCYLLHKELDEEEAAKLKPFFTEATVEFHDMVRPGEEVRIEARKIYFRRRKLKVGVEMKREDGTVVCSGELAGLAVAS